MNSSIVTLPYSFKTKDVDSNKPYIVCKWIFKNFYESFYILYQRVENNPIFLFSKPSVYKAIAIEYVTGTWGIQSACLGYSDYKSKLIDRLNEKELSFDFMVLDPTSKLSHMKYDLESHVITYTKFSINKTSSIPNLWLDDLF